eukprot:GILK01004665.1.p1 GENE.GILK01004665.1~~GILK01004665.1.p1  ORF type:complete len:200 (-),score=4.27 GILK01004665.1:258-857(-)
METPTVIMVQSPAIQGMTVPTANAERNQYIQRVVASGPRVLELTTTIDHTGPFDSNKSYLMLHNQPCLGCSELRREAAHVAILRIWADVVTVFLNKVSDETGVDFGRLADKDRKFDDLPSNVRSLLSSWKFDAVDWERYIYLKADRNKRFHGPPEVPRLLLVAQSHVDKDIVRQPDPLLKLLPFLRKTSTACGINELFS